ncbi:hypothetical protein [Hydrocarboniphaga sp.]|uniref:hypothetical protein n=1 Tax=Hydrocarboniphaga sp. TaxID=2033016 RepID=UPI003D0CD312
MNHRNPIDTTPPMLPRYLDTRGGLGVALLILWLCLLLAGSCFLFLSGPSS